MQRGGEGGRGGGEGGGGDEGGGGEVMILSAALKQPLDFFVKIILPEKHSINTFTQSY